MVYDPSLSAATKTLEIAGRCLQLLGADGATIEPGQDGSVTVRFIGLRPGEDEPAADDEAAAQE
jgi:hypothetical protein